MTPIRETLAEVAVQRSLAKPLVIHFDGSCEPVNPGGVATAGWIIHQDGERIASGFREVKRGSGATNNLAEWCALGLALRWMLDNHVGGMAVLSIRGDSRLVIEQLNGTWACRAEKLKPLRQRCLAILEEIRPATWEAHWIPREENSEADALSRQAYETATGEKYPERKR